jgi:hypothetical protein
MARVHGRNRGFTKLATTSDPYQKNSVFPNANMEFPKPMPSMDDRLESQIPGEESLSPRANVKEVVGAWQSTIQVDSSEKFHCLITEGKRVWGGTSGGSIYVWNAEVSLLFLGISVPNSWF